MKVSIKKQIEALKEDARALEHMVREVNSWDGSLDSYEAYEFDDDFFNTFFQGKPEEAARATFFGSIQNWMDAYIRFNGYGNLESLSEYEYDRELLSGADEIIERFTELADDEHVDVDFLLENWG